MVSDRIQYTEWLAPIPEEEYLRIVYVGKLQTRSTLGNGRSKAMSIPQIQDMIDDIWEVAKNWNSANGVSGHLSWTTKSHVAQLIEGRAEAVNSLMARIRKDPRVSIYKEIQKNLRTMNTGWNVSMSYSFDITTEQYEIASNEDISLQQMFHSMKNTYEIRREGRELKEFYKIIVDTFLLKYISIVDNVKFSTRK